MAVSHVKNNAAGDWSGVVTVHNSQGSTTTVNATDIVRPVDWNSAHNQFYTLSGNTNNASTASGTNVVLQGLGQVTLVGSTATIGISVAPVSHSIFEPHKGAQWGVSANGQSVLAMQPFTAPNVVFNHIGFKVTFSNASNSTGSVTISQWAGIYTRTSASISLLSSTSTSIGLTFSGTVGNFSLQAGVRNLTIPWTGTLTEGDYYLGAISRTTSGGANASFSQQILSNVAFTHSGVLGAASNFTVQALFGLGQYSNNTTSMPNSIAFSEIQGNNPALQRAPIFYLMSQSA